MDENKIGQSRRAVLARPPEHVWLLGRGRTHALRHPSTPELEAFHILQLNNINSNDELHSIDNLEHFHFSDIPLHRFIDTKLFAPDQIVIEIYIKFCALRQRLHTLPHSSISSGQRYIYTYLFHRRVYSSL